MITVTLTARERDNSRAVFDIDLNGRYLLTSRFPLEDSARLLAAQGFDPRSKIVVRLLPSGEIFKQGRLGSLAGI
jgi:hypothetical protein